MPPWDEAHRYHYCSTTREEQTRTSVVAANNIIKSARALMTCQKPLFSFRIDEFAAGITNDDRVGFYPKHAYPNTLFSRTYRGLYYINVIATKTLCEPRVKEKSAK